MTTTWYRANLTLGCIDAVEVASETDKTVTYAKGNKHLKVNSWEGHFPNRESAKAWLVSEYSEQALCIRLQLEGVERKLAAASAL